MERLDRVDHAHLGTLLLDRRQHGVEIGLGDHRHRPARRRRGSRSARSRICAADSSAETYSVRRPAAHRFASAIVVSVDLPIPGAPPIRTSDPGTMPPPRTLSSSPMPGAQPLVVGGLHLAEEDRLDGGARSAAARLHRAGPARSARARRASSTRRSPGNGPPSGRTRDRTASIRTPKRAWASSAERTAWLRRHRRNRAIRHTFVAQLRGGLGLNQRPQGSGEVTRNGGRSIMRRSAHPLAGDRSVSRGIGSGRRLRGGKPPRVRILAGSRSGGDFPTADDPCLREPRHGR